MNMETPILNSVCRPWLVDGDRSEIHKTAELILNGHVAHIYGEGVLERANPNVWEDSASERKCTGVICPLPSVWIEGVARGFAGSKDPRGDPRFGILAGGLTVAEAESLPTDGLWFRENYHEPLFRAHFESIRKYNAEVSHVLSMPLVTSITVFSMLDGRIAGPHFSYLVVANPWEGYRLFKCESGAADCVIVPSEHMYNTLLANNCGLGLPMRGYAIRHYKSYVLAFCCETLQHMNAHNIDYKRTTGFTNDHIPRRQREAQRLPWVRRYILKYKDGDRLTEIYPTGADTGIKPMHMVTGHWMHFGVDGRGKHFGKYVRSVWCPAHIRGNAENGVVLKDIELEASKEGGEA